MNILISLVFGLASSGFLSALLGLGGSVFGDLFGHGDQKNLLKSQKALTDASTANMNTEEAGKNAMIQSLTGYTPGLKANEGYQDSRTGTWVDPNSPAGIAAKNAGTLKDMAGDSRNGTAAGSGGVASFYDPYMKEGSPFLKNIQAASSTQINKQFDQATGDARLKEAQQGFGYAPSGINAAVESSLGRARAQTTSEAYLNNLLQNEQVKFQAAGAKSDILGKAASLYNPASFASAANTSNAQAYGMANNNGSVASSILGAGSNFVNGLLNKPKTNNGMNLGFGGTPTLGSAGMPGSALQFTPSKISGALVGG